MIHDKKISINELIEIIPTLKEKDLVYVNKIFNLGLKNHLINKTDLICNLLLHHKPKNIYLRYNGDKLIGVSNFKIKPKVMDEIIDKYNINLSETEKEILIVDIKNEQRTGFLIYINLLTGLCIIKNCFLYNMSGFNDVLAILNNRVKAYCKINQLNSLMLNRVPMDSSSFLKLLNRIKAYNISVELLIEAIEICKEFKINQYSSNFFKELNEVLNTVPFRWEGIESIIDLKKKSLLWKKHAIINPTIKFKGYNVYELWYNLSDGINQVRIQNKEISKSELLCAYTRISKFLAYVPENKIDLPIPRVT